MEVKFRMGYVGENTYNDVIAEVPEGIANLVTFCEQHVAGYNTNKEETLQPREFLGIISVNGSAFVGEGSLQSYINKQNDVIVETLSVVQEEDDEDDDFDLDDYEDAKFSFDDEEDDEEDGTLFSELYEGEEETTTE